MCVYVLYSLKFSEIIQEENGLKDPDAQGGALFTDGSQYCFPADSTGFIFTGLISHSSGFC